MVGILARAARRDQLEHLTMLVLGPRVGSVHLVGLALGVVGEVDVDATVHRVRLDVLGPVHGRRADLVGREAGPDQHVRAWLAKLFAAVSGPSPWTSGSQVSLSSSNLAT